MVLAQVVLAEAVLVVLQELALELVEQQTQAEVAEALAQAVTMVVTVVQV
jgi:hypothetical protein